MSVAKKDFAMLLALSFEVDEAEYMFYNPEMKFKKLKQAEEAFFNRYP